MYDRIGGQYARGRREDPRIAARVWAALGDASSVVNVGAGAGSYEPRDRRVVPVEPSAVMVSQRPPGLAPAVRAVAEALPFADGAFDAAMGVLTLRHWSDKSRGLAEMRRVARGPVVLLTGDSEIIGSWWLPARYFPAAGRVAVGSAYPLDRIAEELGGAEAVTVPIPADCKDGFDGAYWRRPRAVLDPAVWQGMSALRLISDEERADGLRRLAADLDSGEWDRRFGHLLELDELDLGFRLVVARR